MAQQITLQEGGLATIDRPPDRCPIRHNKISPVYKFRRTGPFTYKDTSVEIVYSCPNIACNETFIAYYGKITPQQNHHSLLLSRPVEPAPLTFDEAVQQISASFCQIYQEAQKAEEFGLSEICGVGYRKSLEFLIKDYLIKQKPVDKAAIEKTMLGPCIDKYIADPRIKEVEKRATWLGNDETHYQRRWIDKDLTDLKTLIRLAIHWIEAEYLTEEALKSMPVPTSHSGKPSPIFENCSYAFFA